LFLLSPFLEISALGNFSGAWEMPGRLPLASGIPLLALRPQCGFMAASRPQAAAFRFPTVGLRDHKPLPLAMCKRSGRSDTIGSHAILARKKKKKRGPGPVDQVFPLSDRIDHVPCFAPSTKGSGSVNRPSRHSFLPMLPPPFAGLAVEDHSPLRAARSRR